MNYFVKGVNVHGLAMKISDTAKAIYRQSGGQHLKFRVVVYKAGYFNLANSGWFCGGLLIVASQNQVFHIQRNIADYIDDDKVIAIALVSMSDKGNDKIIMWENKEHIDYDVFIAEVML